MAIQSKKWRDVKAKIIARYGTVIACGRAIPSSDEAIRQAVLFGRCPRVRRWLQKKGLLA